MLSMLYTEICPKVRRHNARVDPSYAIILLLFFFFPSGVYSYLSVDTPSMTKLYSYIQLKTDCYLHLGLHWESDRPKSSSELVDGRDQSKFLRYVTPGEYGTRKEGVFISVNSGVDYSIYSSSSGSSIGWYK